MPTYRYECEACGHSLELFQSMSERPKRKCPDCGRPKLQRLIGAGAGVIFKGSGFYETDYRSSSYTDGAKADGSAKDGKREPAAGDGTKPAGTAPPSTDSPSASGSGAKSPGKSP